MILQVSAKALEQKQWENFNLKTTTPGGIQTFDRFRAFHT